MQGTGQPNLEMWLESDTRFTFVVDVHVEFVRDSTTGKVMEMNRRSEVGSYQHS